MTDASADTARSILAANFCPVGASIAMSASSSGREEAEVKLVARDLGGRRRAWRCPNRSSHVLKAMAAVDGDEVAMSFAANFSYGAEERQLP